LHFAAALASETIFASFCGAASATAVTRTRGERFIPFACHAPRSASRMGAMRRAALVGISMLLCGFVHPRFERRTRVANVRLTDIGQTYSTINTIDCLGWPSDDIRKLAGSGSWGKYYPANGDVGVAIGRSIHCFQNDVTVVIVRVGDNYVPIGTRGIVFESGSIDEVPLHTKSPPPP